MLGSLARRVRHHSHEGRADLFVRLLDPAPGASLLDLGGSDGSFAARIVSRRPDLRVTVADVEPTRFLARDRYGFTPAAVDPDGPLPFADGEFDVVVCNSVIEHVTLPKERCLHERFPEPEWTAAAFLRQSEFAAEIRRVGRHFFVQTPHRDAIVDPHLWLPLTTRLRHETTRRLVRFTDRFWVKKCGIADWHLLDERRMQQLFPGAAVTVERTLGLPRSVIAWR
jgi:SAM-dependent methyltransferase